MVDISGFYGPKPNQQVDSIPDEGKYFCVLIIKNKKKNKLHTPLTVQMIKDGNELAIGLIRYRNSKSKQGKDQETIQ